MDELLKRCKAKYTRRFNSPSLSSLIKVKDSQNFWMRLLPSYTSCLFSLSLNDNIVYIGKPDWICSPTFVADDFSELLLQVSFFYIKHSRTAFLVIIQLYNFIFFKQHRNIIKTFIFTYIFIWFKISFLLKEWRQFKQ